ncbi:unnamed protein product, partial [Rodentolepis nana]|uniref:SET domain-containing protein n=1 Tax=Rodentolepis nana TaxID=102285 RepID=A0A0R3TI48_RODNA
MPYQKKNMLEEAKSHYIEALSIFNEENSNRNMESCLKATMGLGKILSPSDTSSEVQSHVSRFICFRPKPPSVNEVEEMSINDSESPGASEFDRRNVVNSKLLSAPNGIVRLKDTGCAKTGFTMEVGFCSVECEQSAKNRAKLSEDGNKHIFDCQGRCPFIIFNDTCELPHLAFNCLSKIPPNKLLDYICSTGSYTKGNGHQAFQETAVTQRVPPTVFDPSDYSSIAFLFTGPEKRLPGYLLELTIAAVFLTYCLHLGGYPMKWFNETDAFFREPSTVNRPDIIPASWIAACMLYHLQAAEINDFHNVEIIAEEVLSTSPTYEKFGISIYPTISLINHSCDPTASALMSDKGIMIIYAMQSLSAGSELSIKYHSYFYEQSTQERQKCLKFQYHFHCICEACLHDWNQRSLEGPERLVCQKCGNFFSEDAKECPMCGSKECLLMLKDLRNQLLPQLDRYLKKNICTPEESNLA